MAWKRSTTVFVVGNYPAHTHIWGAVPSLPRRAGRLLRHTADFILVEHSTLFSRLIASSRSFIRSSTSPRSLPQLDIHNIKTLVTGRIHAEREASSPLNCGIHFAFCSRRQHALKRPFKTCQQHRLYGLFLCGVAEIRQH